PTVPNPQMPTLTGFTLELPISPTTAGRAGLLWFPDRIEVDATTVRATTHPGDGFRQRATEIANDENKRAAHYEAALY
ncbi:hypothetical protein ACIPM3_02185, partial [Pseudomonas aeruginosa]